MSLREDQIYRYSRHILLPEVGGDGQKKILNARVLVIGTGGLGSPVAYYLAAAGVGTIGIADGDNVDLSNLQRQILHFTEDLGKPKVESAKKKLMALNPDVNIDVLNYRITEDNIRSIIKDYDFIIDATDNFPAKFLINDACVLEKKPFSHAGVLRFDGQTFTHIPGHMCYRCIFRELPPAGAVPTCSEAGVLGAVVGVLGTIQATEAIKYILGVGELLKDRLLVFDALAMRFREVSLSRQKDCPVCGDNPVITEIKEYEQPVCDIRERR
ncbi:HesA/MoeB/ThiF family protein [Spirochaetia bacterium 38H-sp]|uniref:HesA/MoeB/ThiF family protein n=1 Tax=Rarispira pelagica TaxID=3141764 RepID=A0ABU9UB58_9SPIR